MHRVLTRWYERMFSDTNAVVMLLVLSVAAASLYFFGNLMAPVIVALVLAYLLDWPVSYLVKLHIKRSIATTLVLLMFIALVLVFSFAMLPTVWAQGVNLLSEYPAMLGSFQVWLGSLPEQYPEYIDGALLDSIVGNMRGKLLAVGEQLVQASISSILNLATLAVYSVLVPLMVYFMLADRDKLLAGLDRFIPDERLLIQKVWREMNAQIANYVRGKAMEILIVGGVSYLVFVLMGLRYSALLSLLVGVSVLIPFVGAFAVTLPVAMVGLFQWGISPQFGYLILAYMVIQILDGNLLVPLLFSEAVNLHPLYIIVAVLVFGGLWGILGVFFAIPLATLIKAVLNAWPRQLDSTDEAVAESAEE
ncbi:AI-2E family transporter [Aliagarivorans marinus]|uniref:AI-2E family transporter n=1 Tax=Aliagarivorans marinus TaxID=561965 RepID=UPI00047BE679|nr:AI-2E family transporter [Aliagarivorans marinus]